MTAAASSVATDARPGPRALDARSATILTLCCVIWGVGLSMVKIANVGLPPMLNAGLRSLCAGVLLYLWARWRGVRLFEHDGTLWAGIAAGVCFALEFVALYIGLTETSAARGTIFIHCAPFVAAAGEHFLVPRHRLSGMRFAGLLAAFAGMALALADGASLGAGTLRGDLLCLAGGIFWGMTTIVMKTTRLSAIAPERSLLYQLAVSTPILFAWWLLFETRSAGPLTPAVLAAFAYSVVFIVVIGYTTWFWLMRTYSAASLHAFTFLTPLFGAMAGALILGERVGPTTMAGLALVTAGIWLVNRPR